MQETVLVVGSRVCVTSYGPFWGSRGTVRAVHPISVEFDEPLYFYLIELEETDVGEPIWFAQDEVAAQVPLSVS